MPRAHAIAPRCGGSPAGAGYARAVISVVVPVHDEQESVGPLLGRALGGARGRSAIPWEVVFVDDGSTDGTFAALTRLHAAHDNVRASFACGAMSARLPRSTPASPRRRVTSSSRSTAISKTTRPRFRGCSPSSTRATTSCRAGSRGGVTRSRDVCCRDSSTRCRGASRAYVSTTSTAASRRTARRCSTVCGSTASCTGSYRCSRITAASASPRSRSTTARGRHGRSRYGMERYVRGFLDLITVTFMGRYRHRPLHLFGGVGCSSEASG